MVVAAGAAFHAGDDRGPDAEVVGDGGEGDVLGLACGPQVRDLGDCDGGGQVAERFPGDGAFEKPDDLLLVRPAAVCQAT